MKRAWIALFALLLCITLAGCGNDNAKTTPKASETPAPSEEPTPTPTQEPVYVKIGTVHDVDSYLKIRSGPGTEYDVLGKAYSGDRFLVLTEYYSDSWHQIDFNGGIAYVHANYLNVTEEQAPVETTASEETP